MNFLTSLFSIFQSSFHFDLLLHLYPVWIFPIVVQLTKAKLCLMRLTFGCKKERTCSQTCSSSLFNWGRWRLSATVNFLFCTRNFWFHFYSFPFLDINFCFCFYCSLCYFISLSLVNSWTYFLLLLGCWSHCVGRHFRTKLMSQCIGSSQKCDLMWGSRNLFQKFKILGPIWEKKCF